jgi:glycosyltransferase involved in cell wall biosynthesis
LNKEAPILLSVLLPCLNEVKTLGACIQAVRDALHTVPEKTEIVVSDNGSQDGSKALALAEGVNLVEVERKGYGSVLKGGIAACRGRYVLFADSDGSYDFSDIPRFLEELERGYDLVVGNRFRGTMLPGSMPPLHRYLGNPVLSFLGRLLFTPKIGDFHCGIRAFRKDAMVELDLKCDGMEFATEMIAKAAMNDLSLVEIPTNYSPDGRDCPSHLNTWQDGWRHLRFMLSYALSCRLERTRTASRQRESL